MAYDFDKIARTYDRLNRLMTFGLDRRWRRLGALMSSSALVGGRGRPRSQVLDVACGTGDMAISLAERGCTVTGIDLSEEMLEIAKNKTASATFHLSPFTFLLGNAEALPFAEGEFDAVTCAFGVRNFVHLEQGLSEMLRVLKPSGRMVILELATPDNVLIRPFYNLYTKCVIPLLGKMIAGNREAYTYLPRSIDRFPKGPAFAAIVGKLGGRTVEHKLTFGVCRMYVINKEAAC